MECPYKKRKSSINKPRTSKPSFVFQNDSNEVLPIKDQDDKAVALMSFFSNEQEPDNKFNSMIETTLKKRPDGKTLYKCKACGKEATNADLKKHI